MRLQDLFRHDEVQRRVDILCAFRGDDPGSAVPTFNGIVFHQDRSTRQIDCSLAKEELVELLARLTFEDFSERRIRYSAFFIDKFHARWVSFANVYEGNYGISSGALKQIDCSVNVSGGAQRIGGL